MQKSTDTTGFDRSYRRGVVLGLSLAELFIILVFLLLLVLSIGDHTKEKASELIATIATKDKEIERLNDEQDELDNLKRQAEQNNNQRKIDDEKINKLVAANNAKDKEIERLNNQQNKLTDNLKRQAEQNSNQRKIDDEKINELASANDDKDKEIERLNEKINELRATKNEEIKRLNKLAGSEELDSLGQDSPCWYKLAKRPNGEDYEKHLYIFDIRISDHSILVKETLTPRRYQRQKRELEYDRRALNKELNYEEFIPAFEALKIAGRNKQIRDRRCTFTVRLWDTTSPANKKGYIEARHIVEDIFIILLIQNDPWPH